MQIQFSSSPSKSHPYKAQDGSLHRTIKGKEAADRKWRESNIPYKGSDCQEYQTLRQLLDAESVGEVGK